MPGDWLKLYRQILDSQVWCNAGLLQLWIWCLCKATWKTRWESISTGRGTTEIELQPGQFIFGRKMAAEETDTPPSTVHKRLQKLVELGNVNIQSGTHCSVVTICNWTIYQAADDGKEQASEHPSNRQVTGKEQASGTQGTLKEEGKEREEGKETEEQPTTSASDVSKRKRHPYPPEFETWWKTYPKQRRTEKRATLAAWVAAGKRLKLERETDREGVIAYLQARVEAYAVSPVGKTEYTPAPKRWLQNGKYDDDEAAWQRSDNGDQTTASSGRVHQRDWSKFNTAKTTDTTTPGVAKTPSET